jgi:hypothetical protein
MMRLGAEDISQIKLFDWIRSRPDLEPFCFHVGNERKCTPQAGRLLKRKGVKAGVSDNFVMIPRNGYHGLIVELKENDGKLTAQQSEFLFNMNSQGYQALAVWGFDAAKAVILAYLGESVSS